MHENDVPLTKHPLSYVSERSPLPYLRIASTRRMMLSLVRSGALWAPRIAEVKRYGDTGELDVPGSPRVLFTPGHTLGHCAFHFPERDAVITGDAIVTLDPYTGETGPKIVSQGATADSERALATLDRIAETGASTLLPGHGETWSGGAEEAVRRARAAGVT